MLEYPMSLILWIREDLQQALTGPENEARLKIEDALDRLSSLEKTLKAEGEHNGK